MSEFATEEHFRAMRKQLHQSGYDTFTDDQKWHWHGYDYGWRRVFIRNSEQHSPIDKAGDRFNPYLAGRAEEMFQAFVRSGIRAVRRLYSD